MTGRVQTRSGNTYHFVASDKTVKLPRSWLSCSVRMPRSSLVQR
jgi:hypothetical protein